MNSEHDIKVLRHEICHAYCNLVYGAHHVTIKPTPDGKHFEARPFWPKELVADDEAIYEPGLLDS